MARGKTYMSNTSTSVRGNNKKGRKMAAALITQSLRHALNGSEKLKRRYVRLARYKKAGLVRTGLRRKVFADSNSAPLREEIGE
jgi:hypothetical protein